MAGLTADLTGYNASISRLYNMGEVKKRDITEVFRKADKGVVSLAKATVKKSSRGVTSRRYKSRTHVSGYLKKNIKFKTSKKLKMVFYVTRGAWYAPMYSSGHGSWAGNKFMERAVAIRGGQAERLVREGLNRLIQRVK